MISFKHTGNFEKLDRFFKIITDNRRYNAILNQYGQRGIEMLSQNTPQDTGLTSESWSYEVRQTSSGFTLTWSNSNVTDQGTPIAVLIQYGHASPGRFFVQGYDFINPAMKPVFDQLCESLWKEVTAV